MSESGSDDDIIMAMGKIHGKVLGDVAVGCCNSCSSLALGFLCGGQERIVVVTNCTVRPLR